MKTTAKIFSIAIARAKKAQRDAICRKIVNDRDFFPVRVKGKVA